ncbi:MAG TPA: serine protease [Gammaproteobacteria bacterium]|nr:serine protease [Gammaproteobacteria bacterium]
MGPVVKSIGYRYIEKSESALKIKCNRFVTALTQHGHVLMALIPPFFLDCVVSIGIQATDTTHWIGTGFIVGRPLTDTDGQPVRDKNGQKTYHTFLVTNKHVLQNNLAIVLRFNTLQGARIKDYPVQLRNNDNPIWVGHNSIEVDVAAFNINPNTLKGDSAVFDFFKLDEHTMSVSDLKKNGASEGDGVFVLGFPMGIVSTQSSHAISRSGSIARIRDLLDNRASLFLIDANIFPGNSGSPVIIRPEMIAIDGTTSIKSAALIGIVKGYIPFRDVAISQQTGNTRVIFEENSGLAWVETVDSIKDTVELCYSQIVSMNSRE